jgi:glycolate oxidase FAD binding subunit
MDLSQFGGTDPIVAVGGCTQFDPPTGVRQVQAPSGIVAYEPAEMTVRVRAGTTVAELESALAEHGQMTTLDPLAPASATVGGVLAAGESGWRRLRYGPVRDVLLEARFVLADGRLVKAGGPVVKNVSGFDLCRLLVGSRGTLGVLVEVVLRVQPRPATARWLMGGADPFAVGRRLFRPSSILWDGEMTWVLLEGHPADVAAEASALGPGFVDAAGPPELPPHRWSLRPSALSSMDGSGGRFVAEVGVGTVHSSEPQPPRPVGPLHERVRELFDPGRRFAA